MKQWGKATAGERQEFLEFVAASNLSRLAWVNGICLLISFGLAIFRAVSPNGGETALWLVFGSGTLISLLVFAQVWGKRPARLRWRHVLVLIGYAHSLLSSQVWYFAISPHLIENTVYAAGVMLPALLLRTSPRYFVILLLTNHAVFSMALVIFSRTAGYALFAFVAGTIGVAAAVLAAWLLFDVEWRNFQALNQNRELAADNARRADLARKLEAADQAKSELLASMSHEIRTPMNSVLGYGQLLSEMPLGSTQREYVDSIANSGRLLLTIINGILDFSKMEAGKIVLRKEGIHVRDLVSQIAYMIEPLAKEKKLEIEIGVDRDVPEEILADANRIQQVVVNLLSNAVKFTESGSVKMRVSAAVPSPMNGQDRFQLRFQVTDTGIGIDPEQMKRLFKPFNRADMPAGRRFSGTGLGLVIAQKLCLLMDGDIEVQSTPGVGSTFTAAIRVDAEVARIRPPFQTRNDRDQEDSVDFSALRVLVVEDNAPSRRLVAAFLRRWRISSGFAESGEEAVQVVRAQSFDLILMDIQMPGIDGFEATRLIREWESAQAERKKHYIVALTAYAMTDDRARCLAAGMDDYLTKPLDPASLKTILSRVCRSLKHRPTGIV